MILEEREASGISCALWRFEDFNPWNNVGRVVAEIIFILMADDPDAEARPNDDRCEEFFSPCLDFHQLLPDPTGRKLFG